MKSRSELVSFGQDLSANKRRENRNEILESVGLDVRSYPGFEKDRGNLPPARRKLFLSFGTGDIR